MQITTVGVADVEDLLPLMREYCDFYGVEHTELDLEGLARALTADPDCEGFQLLTRDDAGRPVGFATVYWCWSTLSASRIGVMNDLFVRSEARRRGIAEALIRECPARASGRGATSLRWQTAKDNLRAQRVYERGGAGQGMARDYVLYTY
jgi:ribosomal protein S18 acetylase RimI-like enzyme